MPQEYVAHNPAKKKVYIGGTFDLFHPGHVDLLRRAKEIFGGEVIVGLNRDEFCVRYKRKPMMSYAERKAVLESCKYVAGVVENSGDEDSRVAILQVKPQIIVHGDDWIGEKLMKQMNLTDQFLSENGIVMVYVSYTKGVSSSDVIARCRAS